MTGFDKTQLPHTKTEIHFIAEYEGHTLRLALSRHTIDKATDGQVCFHRWSFLGPVKPRQSTTGSMRPLMGINKAAWGAKLLLTTVSSLLVDCGCLCALLRTQHCCLPQCGWFCPTSASPLPPHLHTGPPPIELCLILQEFKKTSQKPAVTTM